MQYTLPVAVDLRLCVNVRIEIHVCGFSCSECSLNLVAGQVFVGACSVGFFSDLYYQGTNVTGYIAFALVNIRGDIQSFHKKSRYSNRAVRQLL